MRKHRRPSPLQLFSCSFCPLRMQRPRHFAFGRVEDGRGSLGHSATLHFPTPLVEPEVPISGIRLSDWLHRKAHDGAVSRRRSRRSRPTIDNFTGEPACATPCHFVPCGEEVAHALIDVPVGAAECRSGRPRCRSSSTSQAETCSACRALRATDRCRQAPADCQPSS
jgi:hypothetical protein